jgi:hypothetical protein
MVAVVAGRLAGGGLVLVAAAAVVVAAGGGGWLGPLGSLVAGERERTVASAGPDAERGGSRRGVVIVAAAAPRTRPFSSRGRAASDRGPATGPRPGAPGPQRPAPARPPLPLPPGTPPPAVRPVPVPTPAQPAPAPGPSEQPRAVDRVDAAVDDVREQAPEPVRPALGPVGEATDAIVAACGDLPACP